MPTYQETTNYQPCTPAEALPKQDSRVYRTRRAVHGSSNRRNPGRACPPTRVGHMWTLRYCCITFIGYLLICWATMQTQQHPRLGWEEVERLEFMKVLKAPLMVQTPLQVVLEQLFARVQSQANLFTEMQRRIERIEARDINGEELLQRIRLCEEALAAINHQKLSPFNQQQILSRLDGLEAQASRMAAAAPATVTAEASCSSPHDSTEAPRLSGEHSLGSLQNPQRASMIAVIHPSIDVRLESLEGKLAGVYNLSGHMLAVNHMAAELGVEIPDTELAPASESGQPITFQTIARPRAAAPASSSGGDAPTDTENASSTKLQRSGTGLRVAEVLSRVDDMQEESVALKEELDGMKSLVASLQGGMIEARDALSLRVSAVEAAAVDMRENLMQEINLVKKQVNREPEVTFADFSALKSQFTGAMTNVASLGSMVDGLKDTQLPALKEQLEDLRDQVKRSGETREMDTLFHTRINKLESQVGDIKSEVQDAVQDLMQDVAKLSDIAGLEDALNSCATATDVKQLAAQQAALAQSVSGMAEWLAVRPDTADGAKNTGASATRFKCLTCDREIRSQGSPPNDMRARGTFLPKLDGMQVTHGGGVPMGPGLNAGELRRMAEERLSGVRTSSPLKGAEVEDYGLDSKHTMHGTKHSKSAGRTAISVPPSAYLPKTQPGAHRTPVFI